MSTILKIQCDACGKRLRIEFTDSFESELSDNGWHDSPEIVDEHYCPECWEKCKEENPDWED